jgi:hypothetical protein
MRELWLCTPYMSTAGIDRIARSLTSQPGVIVRTRLSPSDWAAGVSDPDALADFLCQLETQGVSVEIGILQRLHAKLYVADEARGILGSANLTVGGFQANAELAVLLNAAAARSAVVMLRAWDDQTSFVAPAQLRQWVDDSRVFVEAARRDTDADAAVLEESQQLLDQLLGLGGEEGIALPEPSLEDLDEFGEWCARSRLAGADVVYDRLHNYSGQNLQGHVKQCFTVSTRFLTAHPEFRAPLVAALQRLRRDGMLHLEVPGLLAAWRSHLDSHARDTGDAYSYAVLRGYLPPSLGGTRLGGGGGSSTLKRVLPLVAAYLS